MAVTDLDLFGNAGRSGYDDIVRMGPGWWTEYLEMDTNYRFAGWILDLMACHLDRVMNNLFFRHADEATIKTMEEIFEIDNEGLTLSLDERRSIAESYFAGMGKLSASSIQEIVRTYTGGESDVWLASSNPLVLGIRIYTDDDLRINSRVITNLIGRRVPSHMTLSLYSHLTTLETEEFIDIVDVRYRIMTTLWTGFLLDGRYELDGTHELAANIYPEFDKLTYTLPMETSEDIGINLYLPSMAVVLDGTGNLDGAYSLNSGREEL